MTKRIRWMIIYLLSIIISIGVIYSVLRLIGNKSPGEIKTVSYTQSNDYIILNATFDSHGNVHLLWMCRDSNFVYQRSTDKGKTWSNPKTLASSLAGRANCPRIVAIGDALSILWTFDSEPVMYSNKPGETVWSYIGGFNVRTSTDDGATWGPEQKVYLGTAVLQYVFVTQGNSIYIAYIGNQFDRYNTYFSSSSDYGLHWNAPKLIGPNMRSLGQELSIAIIGNTIHVVGIDENQEEPSGNLKAGFWYMRSTNMGENWVEAKRIDFGGKSKIGATIEGIKIIPFGDYLLLTLAADDIYYLITKDNGSSWSSISGMDATLPFPIHTACAVGKDAAAVFWVDLRHLKMDWQGHLPAPINSMLLWDADPTWANNDLYYASIKGDHIRKKVRLTSPMSYIEEYSDAMACGQIGDQTMVIWAGKRKVGKTLEEGGMPFEIFYLLLEN